MQEVVPIDATSTTPQHTQHTQHTRVAGALSAENPSVRLQAALAAGSSADPGFLEPLVERCATEPDAFVRDMLSWALTRLPPELVLPRIRRELDSEHSQARGQALHTLSKIGDRSAWPWITRETLRDADDEIARTAWRVAVALVPEDEKSDLAAELVTQLGRGDRGVRLSLSRALVDLGHETGTVLAQAAEHPDPAVAAHARATAWLRHHPEAGRDEAMRIVMLGPERAAAADTAAAEAAGTPAAGIPAAGTPDTGEPGGPVRC
ncbi:HEAT repeat domain-containing protein [Streptomyces collinus]|uniref:HEAT repeat domain-containing protein n=1 Tax=Streptomyces collinus TaxID=42684 RepID=UPI0036ED4A16